MTVASLLIGLAALVVSILAWRDAHSATTAAQGSEQAAKRSADIAASAERHARKPQLAIVLSNPEPAPNDKVIYRVRNDGPQDLDAVVVYRPRPPDRVEYPIAVTGGSGWAADSINLGALKLAYESRFTLCCGVAPDVPEFRIRIECSAGTDKWEWTQPLADPRGRPLV